MTDLQLMTMPELRHEARLRANVLESVKARIRDLPPSFERNQALAREPIARANLKEALDEIALRT